jgi:hypothetical protein
MGLPPEKPVDDWPSLIGALQDLPEVDIACRGEARRYDCHKPKIDRALGNISDSDVRLRLALELAICQRFQEHAPIYLSDVERSYLKTRWSQLIVMQHYGTPTRLLDWTKSPWVAAFFSVFGDWDCDGYLYVFRRDKLEDGVREKYSEDMNKGIVCGARPGDFPDFGRDHAKANDVLFKHSDVESLGPWVSTYYSRLPHFPRLVAQQGLFTFASKPNLDHLTGIAEVIGPEYMCIIRIKAAAKPRILRMLNNVGLNGATLFPGADGIGRSLEGFARSWHLKDRPAQLEETLKA